MNSRSRWLRAGNGRVPDQAAPASPGPGDPGMAGYPRQVPSPNAGRDGAAPGSAATGSAAPGSADRAVTIGTYLALLLLGIALAVLGAFFYSSGPVPLSAIGFDLAIFGVCLLGGWGLRRPAGALAPAGGWFIAAFLLASGTPGGSVLITATTAGTWFLFGGAASAAAGLVTVFLVWSGPRRSRGQGPAGRAVPGLRNALAKRRDRG